MTIDRKEKKSVDKLNVYEDEKKETKKKTTMKIK